MFVPLVVLARDEYPGHLGSCPTLFLCAELTSSAHLLATVGIVDLHCTVLLPCDDCSDVAQHMRALSGRISFERLLGNVRLPAVCLAA
jgi:hypothetical protein